MLNKNINNDNQALGFDIFRLEWISESRSLLMGLAIISVMIQHTYAWLNVDTNNLIVRVLISPFGLFFTNTFLLVSGYGIYYSLNNNRHICQYYKKRISRVYLPFILISFPFYLIWYICDGGIFDFLLNVTSLYSLLELNNGMWYITASMMMYLVAPLLFKVAVRSTITVYLIAAIIFDVLYLLLLYLDPNYIDKTGILWEKLATFVIGMLFASIALNKKSDTKYGGIILGVCFCVFIILNYLRDSIEWLPFLYQRIKEILSLIVFTIVIHYKKSLLPKVFFHIVEWFGRYTLELYIVHMLMYQTLDYLNLDNSYHVILSIVLAMVLCRPLHMLTQKVFLI